MSECIDHGCKGYSSGYASARYLGRYTTKHRKVLMIATGKTHADVVGLEARHLCHNARCINPDHLTWGTHIDNMQDSVAVGNAGSAIAYKTKHVGESNGRCVLSDSDVEYIREHYVKGSREWGLPALARKFGVGVSQIHRVVKCLQRVN